MERGSVTIAYFNTLNHTSVIDYIANIVDEVIPGALIVGTMQDGRRSKYALITLTRFCSKNEWILTND